VRLPPPAPTAPSPDALVGAVLDAARRGDARALDRLERETLTLAERAPPGDEGASEAVQAMLLTLTRRGDYARALAFTRRSTALLGYDAIAASEVMLLVARGAVDEARARAEELASAPVALGGHGLRAIVRTLLGRDADAAADGATFLAESEEVGRSLANWRAVARRYGPSSAHVLSRYAALHAELAAAFPGCRAWAGEPLAGRTIVLQLLEGLGDQIQALRFARAARDAGARVIVGCDERLHDLVAACGLADAFLPRPVPRRHDLGAADFRLVVGPWLHDSGLPVERWPAAPYLDPPRLDAPPLLDGLEGRRVGIVWAGNPDFVLEGTRGLPYGALKRLVAATPGVQWVGLLPTSHPRARDLGATPVTRRVVDAGPTLQSLGDTARLLRHLDLLVTTDSAPAHLAGALGVPVWLLLGPTFNWRWRLDGDTTPLYPSMRLVREGAAHDGARGDWNAAVDRVARDLGQGA